MTSLEDNAAEVYTALSQTIFNPINWYSGKNKTGESQVTVTIKKLCFATES